MEVHPGSEDFATFGAETALQRACREECERRAWVCTAHPQPLQNATAGSVRQESVSDAAFGDASAVGICNGVRSGAEGCNAPGSHWIITATATLPQENPKKLLMWNPGVSDPEKEIRTNEEARNRKEPRREDQQGSSGLLELFPGLLLIHGFLSWRR
jgi:hypothetical protein